MLKHFAVMLTMLFAMLTMATGCVRYEPENLTIEESATSYYAEDIEDISQNTENTPTEIKINEPQEEREVCVTPAPPIPYSSLEEFLDAYVAVSEGRAFGELAKKAMDSNLTSLDTLYLLTNIPEEFQLTLIDVREEWVRIVYVVDIPENAVFRNVFMHPHFELQFTRSTYEDLEEWGYNSPMDGIFNDRDFKEYVQIDEGYYFYERVNTLHWAQGSNLVMLKMPTESQWDFHINGFDFAKLGIDVEELDIDVDFNITGYDSTDIEFVTEYSLSDILTFAETVTIDLQDTNNIAAWSAGDFTMVEELVR